MSRINLVDDAETILLKIRKAKTDPAPLPEDPAGLAERPEARNLVGIYAALADETAAAVLARFAGQGFGAFKPALADLLIATLGPVKARLDDLRADRGELESLLALGTARATEAAAPTLAAAYRAMGLRD